MRDAKRYAAMPNSEKYAAPRQSLLNYISGLDGPLSTQSEMKKKSYFLDPQLKITQSELKLIN